MATYRIAVNMEFVRSADKSFEEGVRIAAELGYRWVEPMVHTGWELLSEVHYFHSFSMEEDPLLMREICDRHGVAVSSISGHSPLMKPEAAVPRLTRAIVLADAVGARFVNTDEMVKPDWMDDAHAHEVMRYSLRRRRSSPPGTASGSASSRTASTRRPPRGCRIVDLVDSPRSSQLGHRQRYLAAARIPTRGSSVSRPRVFHVHAKDISFEHVRARARQGDRHAGRLRLRRGRGRLGARAGAARPARPGDHPQRRVRHDRPGRAEPRVPRAARRRAHAVPA